MLRYEQGQRRIPGSVALALQQLAAHIHPSRCSVSWNSPKRNILPGTVKAASELSCHFHTAGCLTKTSVKAY